MPDKVEQAAAGLQEFAKTRNMQKLEQAVEALEEFDLWSVAPERRLAARRRLLLNWSRALSAIDSIRQPGFDPDRDPPSTRPPAPPGYPPGTDPKAIPDAKVRAEYETALAARAKKKADHRAQVLALELEERTLESAHRVIERWYTPSAADQKEVEAVFEEAKLSAARRADVRNPPKREAPQPPHEEE